MTTTLNIDLGIIVAALAPTIAIIVAAFLAKRDADEKGQKLDGIHTLVNDAMTREKRVRLEDLTAQKIVLERVLGDEKSKDDRRLLASMEGRIRRLETEIAQRDRVAEGVTGFPAKGGGS